MRRTTASRRNATSWLERNRCERRGEHMRGAPSAEWKEQVAADEEERFAQYAEWFTAFQRARDARWGKGRALHRHQVLALRAQFEVLGGLPEHARHGLFAAPGLHEAWIRLSNASMNVRRDPTPDVRGYAIKVIGV